MPDLRVLVADNHPDTLDSLTTVLSLWGHDVRVARSGPEAWQIAQTFWPEVVLTDLVLRDLDGLELARRLQARPTVLVAVTALAEEQYRGLAREAGFHHFFIKPLELDELEQLLANVADEFSRAKTRSGCCP
jgi:two-component system CheB/CheR fusion protein